MSLTLGSLLENEINPFVGCRQIRDNSLQQQLSSPLQMESRTCASCRDFVLMKHAAFLYKHLIKHHNRIIWITAQAWPPARGALGLLLTQPSSSSPQLLKTAQLQWRQQRWHFHCTGDKLCTTVQHLLLCTQGDPALTPTRNRNIPAPLSIHGTPLQIIFYLNSKSSRGIKRNDASCVCWT